MNIISWLQNQDASIEFLTNKYLVNRTTPQKNKGLIEKYLVLFDPVKNTWGNGYYGPKWISTHYTMLELRYMEMSYDHSIYQKGQNTLLDQLWKNCGMYDKTRHVDLCIAGMLLHISCYGRSNNLKIDEIVDYILAHQFIDGGWNCTWDSGQNPKISSVHTTINVIEGLRDYLEYGYLYKKNEVKKAIDDAVGLLLKRELYKSFSNQMPIHEQMIKPHYPPRWKYDLLRVFDFLVSIKHPFDQRMNDALNIIESQLKGPFFPKGTTITGLTHFKLEKGQYGVFNTFRVLKILKAYRFGTYKRLIKITLNE